jgi:hypothetical protein
MGSIRRTLQAQTKIIKNLSDHQLSLMEKYCKFRPRIYQVLFGIFFCLSWYMLVGYVGITLVYSGIFFLCENVV